MMMTLTFCFFPVAFILKAGADLGEGLISDSLQALESKPTMLTGAKTWPSLEDVHVHVCVAQYPTCYSLDFAVTLLCFVHI